MILVFIRSVLMRRFNRYMVECEYLYFTNIVQIKFSFNRYMVECESTKEFVKVADISVLIDTWWNVNDERLTNRVYTLGFNRYMVECECFLNSQR